MDDSGDGLIYRVRLLPKAEEHFGWIEVTEVFWFAVPPDDPFRPANVLDDFMTRTIAGLEELKRTARRKPACPFREVIVTWDTTTEAMDEWRQCRSAYYDDVANASLHGLLPGAKLLDRVSSVLSKTGLPEDEMPSRNLRAGVRVKKRRSGIGPYPELVRILGERVRELEDQGDKIGERVRRSILLTLCKGAVVQEAPRDERTTSLDRAKNVVVACAEGVGGSAKSAPPLSGGRGAEKLRIMTGTVSGLRR